MTATKAVSIARSRIGYYAPRDPKPGSEAGRWMAARLKQPWLSGPSRSIWWCMCFASMCVYQAGGTLPGGPSYNTDFTKNHAKRVGRWIAASRIRPGDLVIFDWNKRTPATDHVGICEANYPSRGVIQCIEGNTSSGARGSQSAGNGVWRRTRGYGVVAGGVRVSYSGGSAPVSTGKPALLELDGVAGPLTIGMAQYIAGTYRDNRITGQAIINKRCHPNITAITYGAGGSDLVAAIQKALGNVKVDRQFGPLTMKSLQRRLGVGDDGIGGPKTMTAWQQRLNSGHLV